MSDLPPDMVSIPRATVERLLAMVEESGFTRRSNFFVKEVADILALSTPPASPDAGRVEMRHRILRVADLANIVGMLPPEPIKRGDQLWLMEPPNPVSLLYKIRDAFMTMLATNAALANPSAPEDAKGEGVNKLAALRVLLDNADGSLDNDTDDQFHVADDADLPDDAEMTVRAGTVRKVNRVFSAIDKMLRAAASNTERE